MSTVRAVDLADEFTGPRQELKRLADNGAVVRLARGVYALAPLGARPGWLPELEVAAMAWATAVYGDRVPILMGLSAARFHHAIPRAIGVAVVALPVQHRPMEIAGGRVVFVARDVAAVHARAETTELGQMLVTSPEQTLVDLVSRPTLGGMGQEATAAARHLTTRVDLGLATALAAQQRRAAPLARFLYRP
ncbi:MAG: type IV toxin-antitoxin system AbiEi family antitoxin [Micropruina sp.]